MLRSNRLLAAGAAAGVTAFAALSAQAQVVPACTTLTNAVYGTGGSAFTPTWKAVAPVLLRADPPVTLVWQDPSACDGYARFADGTALSGTLRYWNAAGIEQQCTLQASDGIRAQFASMGNSIALCPGRELPADVRDFEGPVQTVNIVAAAGSSETSISAEGLYHVFGLASPGQVGPWGDRRWLVKRRPGSFVHSFVAQAIGVPAESFIADTEVTTNQATIDAVKRLASEGGADGLQGALGYVSGPQAETDPGVRTLAYQHTGQLCGYLPDSEETKRDKANVRNGLYYLWAPNHFFAKVDGSGQVAHARVRQVFGFVTGTDTSALVGEFNNALIAGANVPQCAMRVRRAGDLGPISSWAPPVPCGCYFERQATGATACTACSSDANCSGANPKCRSGFCEAY